VDVLRLIGDDSYTMVSKVCKLQYIFTFQFKSIV